MLGGFNVRGGVRAVEHVPVRQAPEKEHLDVSQAASQDVDRQPVFVPAHAWMVVPGRPKVLLRLPLQLLMCTNAGRPPCFRKVCLQCLQA